MKFGDNLKKLRKSMGLSQEELADKVKVSRQSVSKWETGDAYPEMNNILQLCKIFHCSINSLVNDNMIDLDSLDEEIKMSVVKLKEEKQKKVKGLSKAIYIISKVFKVFTIIGIVGVVIGMLTIPFVTSNIKVDKQEQGYNAIKIFGEEMYYERTANEIKVTDGLDFYNETITDKDEVLALNKIIDYIEEKDLPKVTVIVEVLFVCVIAILVLSCMTFDKLYKLFKNIHSGDTPFTMENVGYIKKISCLMIAMIIAKIVTGGIGSLLLTDGLGLSIELSEVLYILILFSLSYIFEYGYEIQLDSKGKMYGDENE